LKEIRYHIKYIIQAQERNIRKEKNSISIKNRTKSSYMDSLPDNILNHIYHDKHGLEFKDTLNMIKKIKIQVL
jgi:hypothetical protein